MFVRVSILGWVVKVSMLGVLSLMEVGFSEWVVKILSWVVGLGGELGWLGCGNGRCRLSWFLVLVVFLCMWLLLLMKFRCV